MSITINSGGSLSVNSGGSFNINSVAGGGGSGSAYTTYTFFNGVSAQVNNGDIVAWFYPAHNPANGGGDSIIVKDSGGTSVAFDFKVLMDFGSGFQAVNLYDSQGNVVPYVNTGDTTSSYYGFTNSVTLSLEGIIENILGGPNSGSPFAIAISLDGFATTLEQFTIQPATVVFKYNGATVNNGDTFYYRTGEPPYDTGTLTIFKNDGVTPWSVSCSISAGQYNNTSSTGSSIDIATILSSRSPADYVISINGAEYGFVVHSGGDIKFNGTAATNGATYNVAWGAAASFTTTATYGGMGVTPPSFPWTVSGPASASGTGTLNLASYEVYSAGTYNVTYGPYSFTVVVAAPAPKGGK